MSLEIKVNDSFVPFEFAPNSVKIDLEWALLNKAEVVVTSTAPAVVRTCKVCEYAHEGLYCTNCFTGERVRCGERKFSKVMKLTPVSCKKA
jgi:hypothetical protein